jgi:hypothetical protein
MVFRLRREFVHSLYQGYEYVTSPRNCPAFKLYFINDIGIFSAISSSKQQLFLAVLDDFYYRRGTEDV